MEELARDLVRQWLVDNWRPEWDGVTYTIMLVWNSKVLKNYKCTMFTNLPQSPYFELTYNGNTNEWYIDAYQKISNTVYKYDDDNGIPYKVRY